MGLLNLVPWRWIGYALAAAGIAFTLIAGIHRHDHRVFDEGAASVQERWDAAEHVRAVAAAKAVAEDTRAALARQQDTDRLAAQIASERMAHARALSAALLDSQRLRKLIDSVTGADRDPKVAAAQPATGPDATAQVLGGLLGSCDAVATQSGGDAEGLADQVRGLQSFILTIKKNP
jgi:hypothetical protein